MAKQPDSDTRNTQLGDQREPAQNKDDERRQESTKRQSQSADEVQKVTQDPAAERGERIDTGKAISRGGRTTGNVAGATEQPSKD